MNIFSWFWKKEEHKLNSFEVKESLKKKLLSDLNLVNPNNKDSEELFVKLIIIFLKDYFKIHYECTFEELISELEHHKIKEIHRSKFKVFLDEIGNMYYDMDSVNKKDLNFFLEDAKEIINILP